MNSISDLATPDNSEKVLAREAAKNAVIASGNAQAVFRRLREIESARAPNLSRWAWELLQNARDAAGTAAQVSVKVKFDGTALEFQHNGPPFRDDEIAHLIFHGSTKQEDRAGIGRFGTGFISTHLLSRTVGISGPLDDGTVFDFTLDRTGNDAIELKNSMDQSWQAMNDSLRQATMSGERQWTLFKYPIANDTIPFVQKGIEELRRVAPFVLAFNSQIVSLTIEDDGRSDTYRITDRATESPRELSVENDDGRCVARVLSAYRKDVCTTIAITEEHVVLPSDGMSRLYVAFPLGATSRFPLRSAINSEQFHPHTERDGIYLDGDSQKNNENRARFELACDAFGDIVEAVAASAALPMTTILELTEPSGLTDAVAEWVRKTIASRVLEPLRDRNVVRTRDGLRISLRKAIIPFAEAEDRKLLWCLFAQFKKWGTIIPVEEEMDAWNLVVESWTPFTGQSPDDSDDVWNVENLVAEVEEYKNIDTLAAEIDGDVWEWMRSLISFLEQTDQLELANQYAILANQHGDFLLSNQLRTDKVIPEDLKDIMESLGLKIRSKLLALELADTPYGKSLPPQTLDDSMEEAVKAVSNVDEDNREASIKLFTLAVKSRHRLWLESIPVVTACADVSSTRMIFKQLPSRRMLAPASTWDSTMAPFADLFPTEFVMHADYAESLASDDWTWLIKEEAVIRTPLVVESSQSEDFIGMMRKDSDRDEARSKNKIPRTHVAHLTGDESVLERVRGSKRLGVLLVRFIIESLIPNDKGAFIDTEVECEDDEKRVCFGAAWIAQLLSRAWVKGDKRASYVSAESLAALLADQPATVKLLLDDSCASLLKSLDVSSADLALRTVGKTETDRMSLIRSLGVITGAVGNDPDLVARFAATIQSDASIIDYIQQRGTFIQRVGRNQAFGFAVENEFKGIFCRDTGVRVTRTGHGHDFLLNPTAGEEEDAGLVEVTADDLATFLELKATRGSEAVYMSVRQVESATRNPDRYWLCVVATLDDEVNSDIIKERSRFVCDIGVRLKDAWESYEGLRDAMPEPVGTDGDASLEVSGQEVRFRIARKLWEEGITFSEAVHKLRPGTDLEPVGVVDSN